MVASLPTTGFSIDASSLPIETVTVYRPSGAQVIRKLDVDLKVLRIEIRVVYRVSNHVHGE